MTTISIPSSVAEILRKTTLPACLVDEQGNVLGSFSPTQLISGETPEQLAELKRRLTGSGPWSATEQVLAYLDSKNEPR